MSFLATHIANVFFRCHIRLPVAHYPAMCFSSLIARHSYENFRRAALSPHPQDTDITIVAVSISTFIYLLSFT